MGKCINYKEDCDNASICPCLLYEENEYQTEDAINKLKQLIQLNMCPKLFRDIIYYLEELKEYEDLEELLIGHTGCSFEEWIKRTTSLFENK